MTYGGGAATAGAAAAVAAMANAIKASGAIINVETADFMSIIERTEKPLIVTAPKGFMSGGYKYITSYRGLIFYAKSKDPLRLPSDSEIIAAKKIWIPGQ